MTTTTIITTIRIRALADNIQPHVITKVARNVIVIARKLLDGYYSNTVFDVEKIPHDIACRILRRDNKCWEEILYHEIRADKNAVERVDSAMREAYVITCTPSLAAIIMPENLILKGIYEISELTDFYKKPQIFQLDTTKGDKVISNEFFLIKCPMTGYPDIIPPKTKCLPQEILDRFIAVQSGSSLLAAKAGSSILNLEIMKETTDALLAAKLPNDLDQNRLYISLKRTYFDPTSD